MGFLSPINLLFGLSLAALVLIYLRARSRPTIDVSSLMLFEEVPAPVADSRFLRVDLLFWLELSALAMLTLAVAGLYLRSSAPRGPHQTHALVFDLGAAMGAFDGNVTRLDEAKQEALAIVSASPAGDEFTVIGHALEATVFRSRTNRKADVRAAIAALTPMAVATQPAALRAALIDARGAAQIDLFADRVPSANVIDDARLGVRVKLHQFGAPADNLAIVSLDPGVPKSSQGRCVIRNFSMRPQQFDLRIESGGQEVFRAALIVEPRAQLIVPFGPLRAGGLVHASILTRDALLADNDRYALAPDISPARALVMSPETEVRDDLARIVLAVNPNILVTAAEPSQFLANKAAQLRYDLAVLHDCSEAGVNAATRLFIFPEPWLERSRRAPLVLVVGSVALAELQSRETIGTLGTPVLLGPSRVVAIPGWMDPLATGAGAGEHTSFPLAAIGRNPDGAVGVITFDIRNHLLLDPDRMDALILTIDTLRHLTAPQNLMVVPTGALVPVATFARTRLIAPDGVARTLVPDQWGRVRFRSLEAGRYRIETDRSTMQLYANYYDAAESDLAAATLPTSPPRQTVAPTQSAAAGEFRVEPVATSLVALALLLLLAQSAVLFRRAARWGAHHV
jgi:aerotolerance regulator-like protein